MRARFRLGRLALDRVTRGEAVAAAVALAEAGRSAYVVTPNADHVVRAETDDDFVKICEGADLVLADGMPVVWASRLLGEPLPERVTGSDLMPALCAAAADAGLSIYLLGGMPGEAEAAAANLCARHPALRVAGTYCPPFGFEHDEAECRRIVGRINAVAPAFVFVGVGSPKQEKWIAAWRHELRCGVLLGIGITIAFLAGTVKRAPPWMQKTGTEWLYRLIQEPQRLFKRYAHDLAIVGIVLRERRKRLRG
jgi:N-acetylglucosaminyldiphosphoundecaprenol N-acetyl-beta-D-mannosaminyltransferase